MNAAKRILFAVLPIVCWGIQPATGNAGDNWMFRRSYYSHADSPGYHGGDVPRSRSAYREAVIAGNPRLATRASVRWNNINLQIGNNSDRTLVRESYYDVNY